MGWIAERTNRNTLHVRNTDTLEHFEVGSEAEVQEVLAELERREEEAKAAEAAKQDTSGDVALPVGGSVGEVVRTPKAETEPEPESEPEPEPEPEQTETARAN